MAVRLLKDFMEQMTMKLRKLITLVLALCLLLSLCVPVYAEGEDDPGTGETETTETTPIPEDSQPSRDPEPDPEPDPETSPEPDTETSPVPDTGTSREPEINQDDVPGITQDPAPDVEIADESEFLQEAEAVMDEEQLAAAAEEDEINVAVPSETYITINPYGVKVDLGSYEDDAQIVHEPEALTNYSGFAVKVDISIRGTVPQGSNASFTTGTPKAKLNQVRLYVEFSESDNDWASTYNAADNQVLVSATPRSKKNVLTIAENGVGYFRVSGSVTSGVLWEDTDTFGAVMTYTFSAAPEAAAESETVESVASPEAAESPAVAETPAGAETPAATQPAAVPDSPELPEID